MRRALRVLVTIAALGAGQVAGAVFVAAPAPAQACSGNHALVVVDTGSAVHQTEVCWSGTITGLGALQLAGANPVTYGTTGFGAAVCKLYGVGNEASSLNACLEGPGGAYWAYFRAAPGAGGWTYSAAGAGNTTVSSGAMEGWRYGTGTKPPFPCYDGGFGCTAPTTAAPATTGPTGAQATVPTTVAVSPSPGGGVSTPATPTAPAVPTSMPGSTTTTNPGPAGSGNRGTGRALGTPVARASSDPGSPVGVVIAGTLLAVALVAGAQLRRRARNSG